MTIIPTQFQERCLMVPEEYNLLLAGGKGGGKSMACILLVLRHIEQYGSEARPLLVRETHKALLELEEELAGALIDVYGKGVKVNRTDHIIRVPNNGAQVELGQIDGPLAYKKYSGRSITLLVVDEVGLLRDKRWIELLRSNLRSDAKRPDGSPMPLRTIWTGNPGGAQHAMLHGMITQAPAWSAYTLNGELWCNGMSTYLDNAHLGDPEAYLRTLRASTTDDELFKAFSLGDWNIAAGAFFSILSPEHHMLKSAWPYPTNKDWRPFISLDFGTGAPSVCYLVLRAPGGVGPFPRGSLILLDEVASYDPNDLNAGLHWPPSKLAEVIVEMCDKYSVHPAGVSDTSYGFDSTLQQELSRCGVYVVPPKKHRISGWARMNEFLYAAKMRNDKPGLWISERCQYFWKTVPFLERDPIRPEDLISASPDHGADSCRYAIMHSLAVVTQGHHVGMY